MFIISPSFLTPYLSIALTSSPHPAAFIFLISSGVSTETILSRISPIIFLLLWKSHPDCLGTTNAVSPNFKFYFLPFSKRIIVHPFKLLAVEEEVFAFRRSDEAKSSV